LITRLSTPSGRNAGTRKNRNAEVAESAEERGEEEEMVRGGDGSTVSG